MGMVVEGGGVGKRVQNCWHFSSKVECSWLVVGSRKGGTALVWMGSAADMIFQTDEVSAFCRRVSMWRCLWYRILFRH